MNPEFYTRENNSISLGFERANAYPPMENFEIKPLPFLEYPKEDPVKTLPPLMLKLLATPSFESMPQRPLPNGWEYTEDSAQDGKIPSLAFTAYFADRKVPLANPSNMRMRLHDESHKEQYEKIFGSITLSDTVFAAANRALDDVERSKAFTGAIDKLGDRLFMIEITWSGLEQIQKNLATLVGLAHEPLTDEDAPLDQATIDEKVAEIVAELDLQKYQGRTQERHEKLRQVAQNLLGTLTPMYLEKKREREPANTYIIPGYHREEPYYPPIPTTEKIDTGRIHRNKDYLNFPVEKITILTDKLHYTTPTYHNEQHVQHINRHLRDKERNVITILDLLPNHEAPISTDTDNVR